MCDFVLMIGFIINFPTNSIWMKTINKVIVVLFLFMSYTSFGQTDSIVKKDTLVWYTDLMKASEFSISSNRPVFAFFTGSDWCGWCKKLQKDVFSKPEFIVWANKNVILLELDFPRNTKLSPELAKQNSDLQQAFQVRGYPTIWLFFMNKNLETNQLQIEALGSLGYPQGFETGKEEVKFLADANLILANKKKAE